jgi:NTE family protein
MTSNYNDIEFYTNNKLSNKNVDDMIDEKINLLLGKHVEHTKTILVLSGGGIKGISHIGALKALEEKNMLKNIKVIAGTSVGGIIGGLLLAGYTSDELYKFIELFDATKLRSLNPSDFFTKFGLDNGARFTFVLEKMFEAKNIPIDITFQDFFKMTQIKLILTAVCMNDKEVYYLSHLTSPNMPVLLGMRMTSSIPFWFIPVEYKGKLFIDGGCIDNYPIQLFSKELDNVIGIYLSENKSFIKTIDNTEEFLFSLLHCFFEGVTCNSIKGFEKQTIKINLPKISIVNLDITSKIKKELFDCGYMSIINSKMHF